MKIDRTDITGDTATVDLELQGGARHNLLDKVVDELHHIWEIRAIRHI